MNFIHSVIFTIKMGSGFILFITTMSVVIETYPAVQYQSVKDIRCFPHYTQVYCTTTYCLCRYFKTFCKCTLNFVTPRIWRFFFVCVPLLTLPNQVSNLFGTGRGAQIYKIGLEMGVTIGGGAAKSGKKTHLLADICTHHPISRFSTYFLVVQSSTSYVEH